MRSSQPEDHGPARARLVTIDAEHAGQRLDNFVAAMFRDVPRSRIYRSLRTGEVRVNKGRARQTYRLQVGDRVRLPPLARDREPAPGHAQAGARALGERLESAVLYEDDHLLVLDKPVGVPVHGGSGRAFGLIDALRAARPRQRFVELVHRLDQETSGCLLIALRRSALVALHAALREGAMDKRYRALMKGAWRGGGRRVDAPLARTVNRSGERIVRVATDGQPASTAFTPIAVGEGASLMEAHPHTGRTHQIRVHAAHVLEMPIGGDPRYGCKTFNRALKERGHGRMFLHATRIGFTHPASGELLRVESPLPPAFGEAAAALGVEPPGALA